MPFWARIFRGRSDDDFPRVREARLDDLSMSVWVWPLPDLRGEFLCEFTPQEMTRLLSSRDCGADVDDDSIPPSFKGRAWLDRSPMGPRLYLGSAMSGQK